MKKMLLSAFVALTFGVSTFANQIAKDENFEFEEELVIDCTQFAESALQLLIAMSPPNTNWNQVNQSNAFNSLYDACESTGNCTTCGEAIELNSPRR